MTSVKVKTKSYSLAVVGATGLVGTTLLSLLEERKFPIDKLFLLASSRSAGELIDFGGEAHEVADVATFDFTRTQFSFFCTGNDISAQYVPLALDADNIVIDKSSHYRYDQNVPLLVPEVNGHLLKDSSKAKLIANPNCTTIPVAVALKPIFDAVGISRLNIATYQAVSGAGKGGVEELADQTVQVLNGHSVKPTVFADQIAFNVIPHIDEFQENDYTREEMKLVWELQKIFADAELMVNPTSVRVPVFYGHSAAVHIETKQKITAEEACALLKKAPGVKLIQGKHPYPTPLKEAAGKDYVYVGRVREDISCAKGLNLWVVADNLRKGAALNAIQIAEEIINSKKT